MTSLKQSVARFSFWSKYWRKKNPTILSLRKRLNLKKNLYLIILYYLTGAISVLSCFQALSNEKVFFSKDHVRNVPQERFSILFLLAGKSIFWVVEIEHESAVDGLRGGIQVCFSFGFRLLSQRVIYWICSISLPLPHLPEPQNFSLSPMISLLFFCAKRFYFP